MRLLQYAFDEAVASLRRGWSSGLLSTATIAIALFVLGAFLIVTSNLERLAQEWSGAAELSVYVTEGLSDADRAEIERLLSAEDVVTGVTFVSKADAMRRFTETFADLAATITALEQNPLPASFDVRLRPSELAQERVDALVARLRAAPGVDDVRYDKEWLDRLLNSIRLLRVVGLALGGALMLAAALTVANVVRLALAARRDELVIMQLVGAPQAYVRGPFVMEGALHGGIGAAVALAGLGVAFIIARPTLLLPLAEAVNLSTVRFLTPLMSLLLIAGGLVVGSFAGFAASRRA